MRDELTLNEFHFRDLSIDQKPAFLWIGCSDSRVTTERITGAEPGEMFVHRNLANMIVPGDLNMLSVVQFAVEVLKVKHVVVCGQYECRRVKTALSDLKLGLIDQWIQYIKMLKMPIRPNWTPFRMRRTALIGWPTGTTSWLPVADVGASRVPQVAKSFLMFRP